MRPQTQSVPPSTTRSSDDAGILCVSFFGTSEPTEAIPSDVKQFTDGSPSCHGSPSVKSPAHSTKFDVHWKSVVNRRTSSGGAGVADRENVIHANDFLYSDRRRRRSPPPNGCVSCLLECVTDDWRRAGTLSRSGGGGGDGGAWLERRAARWTPAVEGRAVRSISHETESTASTRAAWHLAERRQNSNEEKYSLYLRRKTQNN